VHALAIFLEIILTLPAERESHFTLYVSQLVAVTIRATSNWLLDLTQQGWNS
jgi:hypothetical protein